MTRRSKSSGGALKLLALFAISVFVPALGLSALAYRSVEQERRALVAEREAKLRRAGWANVLPINVAESPRNKARYVN